MIYRLKKDYIYNTSDFKILTLPEGTSIDRKEGDDYIVIVGRSKEYKINSKLVENNPDYFEKVDLNSQILDLLKKSKAKTNPKIAGEITTFLEEDYFDGKELVEIDHLSSALEACRQMFLTTEDTKWLEPIHKLGWDVDDKGVFKND